MKQNYAAGSSYSRTRARRYSKTVQSSLAATRPAIPISKRVAYEQTKPQFKWGTWPLTPGMVGLVSAVGAGAVALGLLGSCNDIASAALPCPVPTSAAGTSVTTATSSATPIACTTSGGTHYVWIPSSGGWVQSDDGVHPNPGAHGVGEGEDSSSGHGGVGGHGGDDGG